jgi:hypothetical protein
MLPTDLDSRLMFINNLSRLCLRKVSHPVVFANRNAGQRTRS